MEKRYLTSSFKQIIRIGQITQSILSYSSGRKIIEKCLGRESIGSESDVTGPHGTTAIHKGQRACVSDTAKVERDVGIVAAKTAEGQKLETASPTDSCGMACHQ